MFPFETKNTGLGFIETLHVIVMYFAGLHAPPTPRSTA